jgi:serine/threonine-protein kinase
MSILFQHAEGKAIPPREANPAISEEVDAIIRKTIAINPDERYQSFIELRRAIEPLIKEQENGPH